MVQNYGFDTANYMYNVASAAKAKFGTGTFYARYFNPSPAADLMTSSSAVKELRSGYDYGVRNLAPNSEPSQSRLNGTSAMGQSDAAAFCAAVNSVYLAVGPLVVNANSNRVDCYLSLETSTNLSKAYWTGWATHVGQYNLGGLGAVLYPGMYCNPGSSAANCSSAVGYFCWSVWASEPEPYTACKPFGSVSYQAENCYNSPSSIGTTLLWQMAEQDSCAAHYGVSYPNVDADMSNPNVNSRDPSGNENRNMFNYSTRP
jgi:hypothetical protein